jgi:hypothetical protein
MRICQEVVPFAAMILAATISVANADTVNKSPQIARSGGAAVAAITLPEVVVHLQSL